jgi:hypothetical protein
VDDAPVQVQGSGHPDADTTELALRDPGRFERLAEGLDDPGQSGLDALVSLRLLALASYDPEARIEHGREHLGAA